MTPRTYVSDLTAAMDVIYIELFKCDVTSSCYCVISSCLLCVRITQTNKACNNSIQQLKNSYICVALLLQNRIGAGFTLIN